MSGQTQTTLEDMIFKLWADCVESVQDYAQIPTSAIQQLIGQTRKLMTDANWPPVYQHNFFVQLKDILKAKTLGHPTTDQIIRLLEIETEFN